MEIDDGFQVMFEAGIDPVVKYGPVGFDRGSGGVPQLYFIDGQADVVETQGREPGGILVGIFYGLAKDLAEPVADIDAADHGETVGGGCAGEGGVRCGGIGSRGRGLPGQSR